MKKIIGLTIAAVLIIGMVGGGTWAYFSDTESTTGNTFTAGTLNLDLSGVGTEGVSFTFDNVVPGSSGNLTWEIVNTGSIEGYVDLENISVVNAENYDAATDDAEAEDDSDTSDASGGGELGANLDVVLFWDDGSGTGATAGNGAQEGSEATIYSGDLDSISGSIGANYSLGTGSTSYISMTWSVGTGVDNQIMGDSATLDLDVELAQTTGQ